MKIVLAKRIRNIPVKDKTNHEILRPKGSMSVERIKSPGLGLVPDKWWLGNEEWMKKI